MAGKGIIRIYYKDSSYKSLYLHEDVTAKEVAEIFAHDFLHVDKKVAAHFSLHVIIDGKDVRELKPEDRPLRVQRDLFSLKISWNTDKNYFLFCLSDEAKEKMNEKLGTTAVATTNSPPKAEESELIMPNKLSSQSAPERGGSFLRPSLSRTFSALKPKLSLSIFSKGTKSEIPKDQQKRPPIPNTRSESEITDKRTPPPTNVRSSIERRSTLGSDSDPKNTPKSSKDVSENLRKLVMEERMKLQGTAGSTGSSTGNTPPSGNSPQLARKQDSNTPSPTAQRQQQIQQKETGNNTKNQQEIITATGGASGEGSSPGVDSILRDIVGQSTPSYESGSATPPKTTDIIVQNNRVEVVKTDSPKQSSPGTQRKEGDDISNMFDSIFDWYPAKSTPPSEPSALQTIEEEVSFDTAFDDILGVLNKLKA